jgi:protein gp37
MNKTKIEWTDYTWNPITGCLHGCPYCYAKKITERFPKAFPNGFLPTFYPERISEPEKLKKPSKIFTVSMGDMFGDWVSIGWIRKIFMEIHSTPQHQYQILTKNPKNAVNLLETLHFPNLWLGTSIEDQKTCKKRLPEIKKAKHGGIKFISFEPLKGPIKCDLSGIDWIIIGAQTNPLKLPEEKWVEDLMDAAVIAGAEIFLKNSLITHRLSLTREPQNFPYYIEVQGA